jgi:hypothetical protein
MANLLDYQVDIVKVLVIFYLLIYSSQLDSIFNCLKITRISSNIVVQYIIIFFIFFFLVSSISNTKHLVDVDPIQKLIYSIFYFIVFIVTLRIDATIRDIILILLIFYYLIDITHDHYYKLLKQNNNKTYYWFTIPYPKMSLFPVKLSQINLIDKINTYIIYVIYILVIIGLIFYINEVIKLLKKKVSWHTILFYNYCNKEYKL